MATNALEGSFFSDALQIFRSALDEAPEAVFINNNEGGFTFVNEQACLSLEYSRDELMRLKLWDINPEFLQRDWAKSWDRMRRDRFGIRQVESIHRRKDGTVFPIEVSAKHLWLEQFDYHVSFVREISARKREEAVLQLYQFSLENAPESIYFISRDGGFSYVNEQACRTLGYDRDELLGLKLWDIDPFFSRAEWDMAWEWIGPVRLNSYQVESFHRSKAGRVFPVEVFAKHLWLDDHEFHVAFVRDISDRRNAEEKVRQLAAVVENTGEAVMVTDAGNNLVAINCAFSTITGYSEDEVLGKNPNVVKSGKHEIGFYRAMWQAIETDGIWQGEIWNRRKSGEIFPAWSSISAVRDQQGNVINYVSVFSDISTIKRSQERLDFLAYHDPLTHLPNRMLFNDRLEHALGRAQRDSKQVAVLFIDLDRFKNVNDRLGHPAGDMLLKSASERISQLLRKGDTVARLGGDEFIILAENVDDLRSVAALSRKLIETFSEPFVLDGHSILLTISIGISLFPRDGQDSAMLIRNADTAMYRAKEEGRNNYQFYTSALTKAVFERLTLESELRQAVEEDRLVVYYQPQYALSTGRLVGAEALIRWLHPELGLVPPSRFVPLAEETGLIQMIGERMIHTACRQMQEWLKAGLVLDRMAVNVSGIQLQRGDIIRTIRAALVRSGLDPRYLEIGITEGFVMKTEAIFGLMDRIKKLGVTLAIDDFGTGHSSLSQLKRLPVDRLKIDRAFVGDITLDSSDKAIARAVIALGHSLGLAILAEGIETEAEQELLKTLGCEEGQGLFYSHPLTALEFEESLTVRK